MLNALLPHKEISLKSIFSFEKNTFNIVMAVVTVALIVAFLVGFGNYALHGHHAYGVSKEHPWGLLISMYIFFVVSSTGLCIISSLGHVFHIKSFEFIGKRAIFGAIITIVSGFCVIGLEIGHPIRMVIYNTISPGFTSAIWGMGALYSVYLFLIIMEFIFLSRDEHKWSKFFGLGGLLIGIAAHSNLGAVFGFLVGRPLANGVYRYKMQFTEEMEKFLMHLGRLLGLLIAILVFFEFWRFLTAIYGRVPERSDTALHVLSSKSFWFGEVLLGMAIPFFIILYSKAKAIKATIYASIGGMVGIFFMRYNLVHDTLVYPMQTMKIKEYQLAPTWVEYAPTLTEWAIALGSMGICLALYYIGENFFFLDPNKEDEYFKHYVDEE